MSDQVTITCEDVEALLPLVADGALDCEADPQLFAHLATCPDCQEALAIYDLVDLAVAAEPVVASAEHSDHQIRVVPWPLAIGGGLAAAAAIVLAIMSFQSEPVAEPAQPVAQNGQVIEVIETEDGVTGVVIERDGELLMVRELDQSDAAVESIDAIPVVAPSR